MYSQALVRQTARQYRAAHLKAFSQGGCDALMRQGSKSFYAASRLLPLDVRRPVLALYAFCRVTDDEVDGSDQMATVMQDLRQRLQAIYRGQPRSLLADEVFAQVVDHYQLPLALPAALLEGFEWDAEGRIYETVDELCDYGARVAGSVGAMMALIMGVREPWAMARACELGVAMQLTNIARDVGEDAAMGRCYLPRQWLREEGIDAERWLRHPTHSPGMARVVARLLDHAEALYQRAEQGISALPRSCRPAILSARTIYADIGQCIRRQGFNSVDHRAMVSRSRKLYRVLQSSSSFLLAPAWRRGHRPIEAVKFLVEAALPSMAVIAPKTVSDKAGWMIDLFLELDARGRAQNTRRSGPSGHSPR
ncbi:MAG: phytoene/squalene synthase family protein [Burkholderiaceae bacterium]